jgi:hypothetical protein
MKARVVVASALLLAVIVLIGFALLKSVSWGPRGVSARDSGYRDLSTPSSRLVGRWDTVPNIRASKDCLYFRFTDPELKIGIFGWGDTQSQFKVLSENRSGTEVNLRMFYAGESSDAKCCVTKDGQSLSMEWSDTLLVLYFMDNEFTSYQYDQIIGVAPRAGSTLPRFEDIPPAR